MKQVIDTYEGDVRGSKCRWTGCGEGSCWRWRLTGEGKCCLWWVLVVIRSEGKVGRGGLQVLVVVEGDDRRASPHAGDAN